MAQTKHQIEALLAEAGSQPWHRFGQNFMIDQNLVRMVADAGQLGAGDCAIEVGPGTGTLTEELLDRAGAVIAVEIDRDLAVCLRGNEVARRLMAIPGIGPVGATALAASVTDPHHFRSGRQFAAWLVRGACSEVADSGCLLRGRRHVPCGSGKIPDERLVVTRPILACGE